MAAAAAAVPVEEPRIPLELQSVFLASNRGEEVHEAPRSAFRIFRRQRGRGAGLKKWLPRSRRGKKEKQNDNKGVDYVDAVGTPSAAAAAARAASSPATLKTTRTSSSNESSSSTEESSQQPPQRPPRSSLETLRRMITFSSSRDDSAMQKHQGRRPKRGSTAANGLSFSTTTDLSETEHTSQMDYSMEEPSESQVASSTVVKSTVSPQDYVDAMIYSRGYSSRRYSALQSAYYNRSTPLQQASFRGHLLNLVKSANTRELCAHLQSGLASNPANAYGESLVHKVCRLGRSRLLKVLLDDCGGVDVRVADEHGRTPLHDACAANSLECFELICEQDLRLLYMADHLNMLPLQFVPKAAWSDWMLFLDAKQDEYWPRGVFNRGEEEPAPLLALQQPHSRLLKDPHNVLPLDLAEKLASGELKPEEAVQEKKRRLAKLPMLGQLIANLDEIDDLADMDYDSDITDSGTEEGGEEEDEESYFSSDDDDDDEQDDENSATPQSLDLDGLAAAMNVLGISARAAHQARSDDAQEDVKP